MFERVKNRLRKIPMHFRRVRIELDPAEAIAVLLASFLRYTANKIAVAQRLTWEEYQELRRRAEAEAAQEEFWSSVFHRARTDHGGGVSDQEIKEKITFSTGENHSADAIDGEVIDEPNS